jgi:histidinol-phosphate aminotransferase
MPMKICPSIKKLNPYQGGTPISQLKRELGLSEVIKLASNENPSGLSQKVKNSLIENMAEIARYPDGNSFSLKQALANKLNIGIEQITLGNGSNDILELIARIFVCQNSDEVIFSQYSFVVYPLVTQALGAKAVVVPALDFGHDLEAMAKAITDKTKLIFIANPNNPTGTYLEDSEILNFLEKVPSDVIVVLDQAYFEYSNAQIGSEIVEKYTNLIITRTFSKAYGLAGLRVGYCFSSAGIADYLNRIRQPFNVNVLAQVGAVSALEDEAFLAKSVKENALGLKQLEMGFKSKGLFYIKSFANFVSVKVENAPLKNENLLKKGIIVRLVEMPDFLRISVGTKEENDKLLKNI